MAASRSRRLALEPRKPARRDFIFLLSSTDACGKLLYMRPHRISEPDGSGNQALQTVKAARWTISSVGLVGHRSVAMSSRSTCLPRWSLALCFFPPVSVGLRTIETGGANLVQRQSLGAFAASRCRCKSPIVRLYGGHFASNRVPPASDPRSGRQRSSRDVKWRPIKRSRWSLPCCQSLTAVRSNVNDRAQPAL